MVIFNNYSKIRFLISIIFGILLLYVISQQVLNYITFDPNSDISYSGCNPCKGSVQIYKEYLEAFLLLTGMISFTLNRKLTDYISFTVFIFLLGLVSVQFIDAECLMSDNFSICMKGFILILLFLGIPLMFLTINFFKYLGKE